MDDDVGQETAVHGCEAISNDRPVSGANRRPRRSLLMKRNRKRIIAAIAVIGVLAAGWRCLHRPAIPVIPATNGTNTAASVANVVTGATGHRRQLHAERGRPVRHVGRRVPSPATESANTVDAGFGTTATNGQLIACVSSSSQVGSGTYSADYDSHCNFAGSTMSALTASPSPRRTTSSVGHRQRPARQRSDGQPANTRQSARAGRGEPRTASPGLSPTALCG